MKNSQSNTAVATTTNKAKAQSVAVSAVKAIAYPIVVACDLTSTAVNYAQAKAIHAIDGTSVDQSIDDCISYSNNIKMQIMLKHEALMEKLKKQREANRQQDIAKHKTSLDKLEGVEQMPETEFIPINKRGKKLQDMDEPADILNVPLMTPQVAFQ